MLDPGERPDCHVNAVALWRRGDAIAVGTGYALSPDLIWRQHSWAWDRDGRLIETTETQTRYFSVRVDRARPIGSPTGSHPPATMAAHNVVDIDPRYVGETQLEQIARSDSRPTRVGGTSRRLRAIPVIGSRLCRWSTISPCLHRASLLASSISNIDLPSGIHSVAACSSEGERDHPCINS